MLSWSCPGAGIKYGKAVIAGSNLQHANASNFTRFVYQTQSLDALNYTISTFGRVWNAYLAVLPSWAPRVTAHALAAADELPVAIGGFAPGLAEPARWALRYVASVVDVLLTKIGYIVAAVGIAPTDAVMLQRRLTPSGACLVELGRNASAAMDALIVSAPRALEAFLDFKSERAAGGEARRPFVDRDPRPRRARAARAGAD